MLLTLLVFLQTKHLLFDFLMQPPWMYKNKGTYGHMGGVAHALLHGVSTYLILSAMDYPFELCVWVLCAETIAHYHIDWAKMNLNSVMRWGPTTSEWFWRLLGSDQYLHQLTYLAIAAVVVS